jgi:hypothetical protein
MLPSPALMLPVPGMAGAAMPPSSPGIVEADITPDCVPADVVSL